MWTLANILTFQGSLKYSVSSDCPSDECWTYNSDTDQCELNENCSSVTCGAKDMDIVFTSNVFGEGDIYPTPTVDEHGVNVINCELGRCGMSHFIEDNQ